MSQVQLGYLLKKFPRLSETFVLNEILAQEDLGRSLRVFARRAADDEPRHPELARLRAEVETLPPSREIDPWETLFGEAQRASTWSRLGPLVREGRGWGLARFPSLLVEALHLYRRVEELGIRHVHAHFATDSATVAMLLQRLGGPTYSLTAHAKDIYRSTVDPAHLNRLLAESVFTVTVCDANVRHLAGLVGEQALDKVRRLYNGIDSSAYAYARDGREPDHVLGVGRLVEKKGFDVLVDAAQILVKRGFDLRVSIAGEGEQRAALERRIAEQGLGERVRLLGACDQDQVRSLMRRATLLALPCRIGEDGNRDALPTVLLEALAAGLPCVSTPVTGIPEILDGGKAGSIVAIDDPVATAEAVAELLADGQRQRRVAEAGRRRVLQLFDRDETSRVLHGWFQEALEEAPVPCGSPS